jgi:adenosylcobinamide-phosphate synthase
LVPAVLLFSLEAVLGALALALLLDALTGDPGWLYARIAHPVVLLGRIVSFAEARWRDPELSPSAQRRRGALAVGLLLIVALLAGGLIQALCQALPFGWILQGVLMSSLLAQRSLADHVQAVAAGLGRSLEAGRAAVSRIVGRDPAGLDRPAIARAAIESLAENFADGVVAPLFWGLLLGLPGMLAYKAINTADSMIGYRNTRYLHFGRFAARTDDLLNWAPARLAGGLLALAAFLLPGARPDAALRAMRRDAAKHRSPNAGWPEAAMAGALGFRLAGPRSYGGKRIEDAWLGDGRAELGQADIEAALGLFWRAWLIPTALVLLAFIAA